MRIYLVCSTADNWMKGGYGASLLAGEASRLLVSFVEFAKDPRQRFIVDEMPKVYQPLEAKAKGEAQALPSLVIE